MFTKKGMELIIENGKRETEKDLQKLTIPCSPSQFNKIQKFLEK